jgi:hypothetical protein
VRVLIEVSLRAPLWHTSTCMVRRSDCRQVRSWYRMVRDELKRLGKEAAEGKCRAACPHSPRGPGDDRETRRPLLYRLWAYADPELPLPVAVHRNWRFCRGAVWSRLNRAFTFLVTFPSTRLPSHNAAKIRQLSDTAAVHALTVLFSPDSL